MFTDLFANRSTVVPVGEDQKQHIELARSIAETFNRMYGEIFPLPTPSIGKSIPTQPLRRTSSPS